MRFLWEFLLEQQELGVDFSTLRFVPAKSFSPYLELALTDINSRDEQGGQSVEVNPYLRFHDIFKELFHPDLAEYEDTRMGLFHLMLHQLAEADLKRGMNHHEFYKKFVHQSILAGCYGERIKANIQLFSNRELQLILSGLLKLSAVGDSLELLKEMLAALFRDVLLCNNVCQNGQLLIYIGAQKTIELEAKVGLVLQLFMNFRYQPTIYYQYHFAVLGMDETCRMDEIALY